MKWYKRIARASDDLTKHGAILLEEEQVDDPILGAQTPNCSVIELETIVRREYIVRDFSTPGRFHVSPFKHK